uniref:MICAL-like 1a n=1 Tax=Cynoglossus semilaevis TaxID=244447 RepID=A0A3P8VWD9_CYNSE
IMGSLRALQEWCRLQCEHYDDVEIKDMSTSFRDGLAFCAIIHRYRPDLIDLGSLSKENVYENNRLAFEVAETQLGIPALLDPEDMVSMKVPDRLSIITYVSQYYNFFNNKSQGWSSTTVDFLFHSKPSLHEETKSCRSHRAGSEETSDSAKRSAISSTCAACQKHVHLVQRFLVDGKLYHRNCFRCSQCHSTLLPGSYRLGHDTGTFVCSHHLARQALANQNGRPDLSKKPEVVHSARLDRSPDPHSSSSVSVQGEALLSGGTPKPKDPPWLALVQSESKKKKAPAPPPPGLATPNAGSLSSLKGDGSRPSTPPPPSNPFEDDDDETCEVEEEEAGEGGETITATHPWYSITRATETSGKRPAPRAPLPPAGFLPHSVPSSCSPSPALSIESLSSGSDHSSSHPPHGGSTGSEQEHIFTKSVSEPSISSPGDSTALPPSSSNEHLLHPPLSPPSVPSSASSAPATPQTSRSSGTKGTATPSPRPQTSPSPLAVARICKENPFNRKASPSPSKSKTKPPKGSRPARPPAPGHGFPLIKRKVQSDQFIPVEDIHGEMSQLEKQLDDMEQRGVELEKKLRDCPNDEDEEHLLVDWFTLIHEKHLLVRREAELVYTAKQQNLEERQADVEYELRCLLNKPEKDWTEEDKNREQELMAELVTIIEQRNQIVNNMDQDRQREEEEDKLMEAMLKKKGQNVDGL